jgi:hypothetical protein
LLALRASVADGHIDRENRASATNHN